MKNLFETTHFDREFYNANIRDFLPANLIDVHTHVWRGRKSRAPEAVRRWPSRVADRNPVGHLLESYELMLPGKRVTPVLFGSPSVERNTDGENHYAATSAEKAGFPALMLSRPEWQGGEFIEKLTAGKFRGAKPYLSFAPSYIPPDEIRIFDFIPHHQLDILNRRGLLLMLHIPRPGRLNDAVNLAQVMEIERNYPRIKLIIAHAGRAYCPENAGGAFKILKQTKNMMFDISANTNVSVFRELIETAGPERILFGSDLPITRMRMRRVCRKGVYVNIVPAGLYGDVSGDKHMEEAGWPEAGKLTFFLYEEINAFRNAANRARLGRKDIENVFVRNAERILHDAEIPEKQLMMRLSPGCISKCPAQVEPPAGYVIRTFAEGDEKQYAGLLRAAGFTGWNSLDTCLDRALPRGIFFAVHKKTGRLAGTCSALHKGELAWLGVRPSHRGRGLGETLCRAVVKRFRDAGYDEVYLKTDDFRLPAVRIYLRLGFNPHISPACVKKRWAKVYCKLNLEFKGNSR